MQVYGNSSPGALRIGTADAGGNGDVPLAVLPSGTLLRPVLLAGNSCQAGGVVVFVRIESGQYGGQRAAVASDALFLNPYPADRPNQPTGVVQWEANPVFLEPARQ